MPFIYASQIFRFKLIKLKKNMPLYLRNINIFRVDMCGNTTPAGRSVFTQFRVFPIFMSVDITVYQFGKNVLYFIYNIAQRTLTEEWREIFRVDIELYKHGS